MLKDTNGNIILETDARLIPINNRDRQLQVTEAEFFSAIKAYKLDEALEQFAIISKKIFDNDYPETYHRMGRTGVRHPSGVFVTQFALEYLASAMILSGSNDWKKASIKNKDNILGLLNIYQNSLIQGVSFKSGITSMLVPMYFQQFISQADPKNLFTRQWYIFSKISSRFKDDKFDNLNALLIHEVGLSILDYTKLCFLIFAALTSFPRFNIGKLSGAKIVGLQDVLDDVKIWKFLDLISADYKSFRELDKQKNANLDPKYTKTKFNILWLKPLIKMGKNDFLAPSMTAYMTSTFKGLYWWFDNYFRNQSLTRNIEFRNYFGLLFQEYAGDVIKDIYGEENVFPEILINTKKWKGAWFDWIVEQENKIILFEIKSNQFPLEVLQKGDPDDIRKQVVDKIIKAIIQMYKRVQEIGSFETLKHLEGKVVHPIAVFYDIPLISTPMYAEHITPVLETLKDKYPNILDFKYNLMSIEELEDFYYVADQADLEVILKTANQNAQTGFSAELAKITTNKPKDRPNILDRNFDEYCSSYIGVEV